MHHNCGISIILHYGGKHILLNVSVSQRQLNHNSYVIDSYLKGYNDTYLWYACYIYKEFIMLQYFY